MYNIYEELFRSATMTTIIYPDPDAPFFLIQQSERYNVFPILNGCSRSVFIVYNCAVVLVLGLRNALIDTLGMEIKKNVRTELCIFRVP